MVRITIRHPAIRHPKTPEPTQGARGAKKRCGSASRCRTDDSGWYSKSGVGNNQSFRLEAAAEGAGVQQDINFGRSSDLLLKGQNSEKLPSLYWANAQGLDNAWLIFRHIVGHPYMHGRGSPVLLFVSSLSWGNLHQAYTTHAPSSLSQSHLRESWTQNLDVTVRASVRERDQIRAKLFAVFLLVSLFDGTH
jgi:hypothetical protein